MLTDALMPCAFQRGGRQVGGLDRCGLRGGDGVGMTDVVKDMGGTELVKLQKRLLRARDTMAIERRRDTVARVKKAVIAPLRDRFTIELTEGGSLDAMGSILDHECQITPRWRPGRQYLQALVPRA
jgi:uncharacterized protein YxjI